MTSDCASPIVFLTEHSLPGIYLDETGNAVGPTVQLVQALVARMDQQAVYYLLPWARAFLRAQQTPRSVLFETVRTPEREALFQWVGPVKHYNMHLYGPLSLQGVNLSTLSDTTIACGYRGASYIPALQAMGFKEGANLVLVTRAGDCIGMLKRGRADVTPLNLYRHGEVYSEAALNLVPLHAISEVTLYLAFSLDFTSEEIAHWQHNLETLYQDGTLRHIYQTVFSEEEIRKLEQFADD
ncbi:substrate-binding periplasmic protein [Alishewanella tabrizica]|uniref:Peptide ABC transporter ATP-binding protein n=1 Tax=Alishewanella tabrizica TaxID=671278 RepID=A0ABQ2WMT4_9ALTE|nr:ABC transporter substrate-binding protein [Alishewanella tabrizica]GGW59627.1 peptide ABC transporter ATP-binding protein [Alishewanella tabrizica]